MASTARKKLLTVHSDLTGLLCIEHGRKSTPDPKNPGKSVFDQFSVLDGQTADLGMVVYARVEEDNQGASAFSKNLTRAKLEHTMTLIRTQPIAVVAFWALNRHSRRLKIHGEFMELCYARNVLLLIGGKLMDPRDPADSLQLGINAVVNEHAAAVSRIDTLRGVASTAVEGKPHGPNVYGYRRIYDSKSGQLERVEIDPDHQRILLEIADRALDRPLERDAEGLSLNTSRAIVADLNTREDARRPRGGRWHASEIRNLLLNPTYYGKRSHTLLETGETLVYDAIWPAIFTDEQHAKAVAFYAGRSWGEHSALAKYLLTGVAFCDPESGCGSPMYVHAGKRVRPGLVRSMGYQCHNNTCRRTRSQPYLDRFALERVQMYLDSPEFAHAGDEDDVDTLADYAALTKLYEAQAADDADLEAELISARSHTIAERGRARKIADLHERIEKATVLSPHAQYRAEGSPRLADMPLDRQRQILKRYVRVLCLPSRRGKGFDEESVRIVPALRS
jgi:DNA invertase Pin-like site-specific DNA recombinase